MIVVQWVADRTRTLRVNVRALLRPWCWLNRLRASWWDGATGHDPLQVWPGDWASRYHVYCRRCGFGWRRENWSPIR